ncbi:MAG: Gfo/Idh/MocA family oxidoreductase [Coxiellaceae bacterium]|nr:Gfo/Idh/MocA family oxidoreductase [Coxiellaceae bacterium]
MSKLRTAVIGVGYLGHFHAEKYAKLAQSNLIAVCDSDQARCDKIAQAVGAEAIYDHHQLIGKVDAVSIAVPTAAHYDVAKFFIENGIHVLIEKPITTTIEHANDLIKSAKANNVKLQVGHLERYNNVIKAVDPMLHNPRFIESVRLAPFKLRGTDVNVALDLMIHDIDIIQSLVHADITHISANGASVLSEYIDIANARIEFSNGCVANVTASRISLKQERRIRIFQHDCYLSLDLDQKKIYSHAKGEGEMFPGIPEIISSDQAFDKGDALNDQIDDFLNCIIEDKAVTVSGEDGKHALEVAIEITRIMREQNLLHVGHELGRPVAESTAS